MLLGYVIFIGIILRHTIYSGAENTDVTCSWKPIPTEKMALMPEVFFINMDSSPDRRRSIEMHLRETHLPFRRVKGLHTFNDIYFPQDIITNWNKMEAKIETDEVLPSKYDRTAASFNSSTANFTHVMSGLIGRSKKNKVKELGCTSSHLEAMRQAIYFNRTASRFALITEDDIQIPFNIDFEKLVASAPKGFGILQLFNSNEESMESSWMRFIRSGGRHLWTEIYQKQPGAFWSTCAYLIDREVMKPIIDKVAFLDSKGWVHLKIVAGIKQPCRPKLTACCQHINGTFSYKFIEAPPCIWAPKGFQADSFIYAMARTYAISVPLITNGAGGNQSTFHQDHVESIHESAFARQRRYINDMILGKIKPPAFASPACREPLPIGMTLYKRPVCLYRNNSENQSAVALFWIYSPNKTPEHISNMSAYLRGVVGIAHYPQPSVVESQLLIPRDVSSHWEHKSCVYQSSAAALRSIASSSRNRSTRFVISGLCGRGKGRNTLADLSHTVSHLLAIRAAVYSHVSQSHYAIIADEDVILPFDIDFDALIATAPHGFAMLRLTNFHEVLLDRHFSRYLRNSSELWSHSNVDKFYDDWAAKAYVIDRRKMKPIIDQMARHDSPGDTDTVVDLKVIAGLHNPCIPSQCCPTLNDSSGVLRTAFVPTSPCVDSRFGFQSERFIFNTAPTYILNIPLVSLSLKALNTTSPEKRSALSRQKQIVNDLITAQAPLPYFAKFGCNKLID